MTKTQDTQPEYNTSIQNENTQNNQLQNPNQTPAMTLYQTILEAGRLKPEEQQRIESSYNLLLLLQQPSPDLKKSKSFIILVILGNHRARDVYRTWQNPSSTPDAGTLLCQAVNLLSHFRMP